MVDPEDKSQVGASIPGAVSKIAVKVGDKVELNQTLLTIEAMKMETAIPARMEDKSQVGASIPGAVSKIAVKVGDKVELNQTLLTIEAMKMETAIPARMAGVIERIEVTEGQSVKGGQLLMTIR